MSDKLQKTDREIAPASSIADAIEHALPVENKPAQQTAIRYPGQLDVCKCGHLYSAHNYSDSLGSKTDPLGFMYECRGAGFSAATFRKRPDGQIYEGAVCTCKKFEFASVLGIGIAVRAPQLIVTSEVVCINTLAPLAGPHSCPGYVYNALDNKVYCQCSCESCLTSQRRVLGLDPFTGVGSRRCLGGLGAHERCPVVIVGTMDGSGPVVCKCDCIDCKRLWWGNGRPIVRDGRVVREGQR